MIRFGGPYCEPCEDLPLCAVDGCRRGVVATCDTIELVTEIVAGEVVAIHAFPAVGPLELECPTCGAFPGERCENLSTGRPVKPHAARL